MYVFEVTANSYDMLNYVCLRSFMTLPARLEIKNTITNPFVADYPPTP